MKIEVEHVNGDGSTVERWSGPGAREAAFALVEPDWLVLAVSEPAPVEGAEEERLG